MTESIKHKLHIFEKDYKLCLMPLQFQFLQRLLDCLVLFFS